MQTLLSDAFLQNFEVTKGLVDRNQKVKKNAIISGMSNVL